MLIGLRLYSLAYWGNPVTRFLLPIVRSRRFAAVVANDLDPLPLATRVAAPLGRLADLHEYFPNYRNRKWRHRLFVAPFHRWIMTRFLPKFTRRSTVAPALAAGYEATTGTTFTVVPNALPYQDVSPTPVHDPLRLVHTGGALPGRGLTELVEGTMSSQNVTLDMFLVPTDPNEFSRIQQLAARSGGQVRIHAPVPHDELVATLNDYDVAAMFIQPVNFSYLHALPNKFFEGVQARVAILTGPSPQIATLVDRYDLGVVAPGFTARDVAETIANLSTSDIEKWKRNSQRAAHDLSFETYSDGWQL